tara:strand:+ start:241 stop:435 length:195 start_codon:yes stop_codon:yes gene_type:complete
MNLYRVTAYTKTGFYSEYVTAQSAYSPIIEAARKSARSMAVGKVTFIAVDLDEENIPSGEEEFI